MPEEWLVIVGEELGEFARRLVLEAEAVVRALADAPDSSIPRVVPASLEGEIATVREKAREAIRPIKALFVELESLRRQYSASDTAAAVRDLLPDIRACVAAARGACQPVVACQGSLLLSDAQQWLADLDAAVAELVDARDWLRRAGGVAASERRAMAVELFQREAMCRVMNGDHPGGSASAADGIAIAEVDRAKVNAPFLRDSYLRGRRRLYVAGVLAAWKLGDHAVMLERAELTSSPGKSKDSVRAG
jgi:hypothetical protein